MKKLMLLTAALWLGLSSVVTAAEARRKSMPRFFGKVTAVDVQSRTLTAYNKKNQTEERFTWNDETRFSMKQKAIAASELREGQNVSVAYLDEEGGKRAKRVSVRAASKKKTAVQ